MFFKWIHRAIVFIILVLFRKTGQGEFLKKLTKDCKPRRRLAHVQGITEELEEVLEPPDDVSDDATFLCFNKDGCLVTAREHKTKGNQNVEFLTLDIPGVGKYQNRQSMSNNQSELKLEMVDPMRKWRIHFRGLMSDVQSRDTEEPVYVTVVLYWICCADPFDHYSTAPSWTLAKCFDDTGIADAYEAIASGSLVFYEQWGDVSGRITIEGQQDIEVIGWKCPRIKLFRKQSAPCFDKVVNQHIYIDDDGTKLVSGVIQNGSKTERKFGFLTFPIGEMWATDTSNVTVNYERQESPCLGNPYTVSSCGMPFNVNKDKERVGINTELFGESSEAMFTQFNVNGKHAYGVTCKRIGRLCIKAKPLRPITFITIPHAEFFVGLENGPYSFSKVGGKASKLSILHQKGYNIPAGICLTVDAFDVHVYANEELRKAVEDIKMSLSRGSIKELPEICTRAVDVCKNATLESNFRTSLEQHLRDFMGEPNGTSLAIRSSGVNEDGGTSSFAGQLETFLGVTNIGDMLQAVKDCWASNLSYRAVEYRRQLGQPLVDGMGVLIQKMVAADVAGVLFTNHPLTGNPSTMVINASYGLGETVVSGEVTPDMVTVQRKDKDRDLVVQETIVGSKSTTLHLRSDGSTEMQESNVPTSESAPCLVQTEIIEICRKGIEIEGVFDQPQDVEWAIAQSQLYILQTRPITSTEIERDEDMFREFDTGYLGDQDCYTFANVGEVLPGAATPLTFSVMSRTVEIGFNYAAQVATSTYHSKYGSLICGIFNYRFFINLTTFTMKSNTVPGEKKTACEIFLVGQPVPEHTQSKILALQGRRPHFLSRMIGAYRHFFIEMRRQPKRFYEWAANIDSFFVGDNCYTAATLYDAIDEKLPCMIDSYVTYSYMLGESSTWAGFIMLMLKGSNDALGIEGSSDMSILLSECDNVESADVPSTLNRLAEAIRASDIQEEFLNSTDEQCHSLLCEANDELLKSMYTYFLKRHGHRCIREFELYSKSWDMKPSVLMYQLKIILKSKQAAKTTKGISIDEAVDSICTPITTFQKYLLKKFMVRKARAGVAARERGKSVCIKTVYRFKNAYWRLADMMVREGRIPDENLVFFLTHREVGMLLENQQNASLITRAKRRMRIKPILENMQFPLLNFCRPKPFTVEQHYASSKSMKGLPVGRGVATGRACVIHSVVEANAIQEGDILICPYTDIGWTPYFSIISGIVTELGGMISHGAVVARELGLPCVANVQGATSVFKTGDRVKIDGLAGTLELLEE